MDNGRQRIYSPLNKLNDDDRNALCVLLIKAGYAARIGKEMKENQRAYTYFVEYWEER